MKQTEVTVKLIVEAYYSNDHEASQFVEEAQLRCSSLVMESAPVVVGTAFLDASVNDSSTLNRIELEELNCMHFYLTRALVIGIWTSYALKIHRYKTSSESF